MKTGGVATGNAYFQDELFGVDVIIKKDAIFRTNAAGGAYENEFFNNNTDCLQVVVAYNTAIQGGLVYTIFGSTRTVTDMYVTVQYTKTTD